jgi:hypothetical protein
MKNILKTVGASVFLCLLFAMPAIGQITNPVYFTTTFPFYAGNMKLPAGTYTIKPSGMDQSFMEISDKNGGHSGFLDFTPTATADQIHSKTEATFNRYGTTEFLNMVWASGQTTGIQLEPSKMEQKLAASSPAQKHTVPGK